MHDEGGADIPVLVVDWSDHTIGLAMKYWRKLSTGDFDQNLQDKICTSRI